ncbi:MAG: carboxypeptidase-like regulatory domain-containing protein, partial [Eudoraea sp.]|nr:carboxypeptidase-like regulatory domain-containing protein [Eudoraea sp.]
MKYFGWLLVIIALTLPVFAMGQNPSSKISGTVTSKGGPVAFASVFIKNTPKGTTTDENGHFNISISSGELVIVVRSQGYRTITRTVQVSAGQSITLDFALVEDALGLDEAVITATRNRVERKSAPVVVSTIKPRLLTATQSISLADGLNFVPGVRVETNCQNCGFTQVRLNGLDGGYTQILLNSRPIFTSLLGV